MTAADSTPGPRSSPWLGASLAVAVLAGASLTAYGWFAHDGRWRTAPHLSYVAGILGFVLAVLGLGARRQWRALPIGVCAAVVMATAFGQLGAIATVAWFALSSVAFGRLVLRSAPQLGDLECGLVGMVLHGTVVGLLVAWPVNVFGVYALLLTVPMVLARRDVAATLRRTVEWFAAERQPGWCGWRDEAIAAAVVALALVHLLVASMPEFGHDALVSHLMMPARIAYRGVWEFDVAAHVWCVMPALGDWLYTVGYVLAGESGARLVNLACVLVLARLVFDVARWVGAERSGALAAVVLFLATPLTLTETSSLFIEGAWSCCIVGMAMAVLRAVGSGARELPAGMANGLPSLAPGTVPSDLPRGGQLVVAGMLAGGGMAAKMITLMALPLLALVLALRWRTWWPRHRTAIAVALVASALIGGQPYVRALWLTGNPVFPFFNGVFKSPYYPPENFVAPHIFDVGTSWDVLYRMTFDSSRFLEASPGAGGFHWLLVVAPALLGFVLVRHRRALVLAAFAAGMLWLVFKQTAYLRYVFPTFAIACALGGAATAGALPRTRGSLLLGGAVVAAVVLDLVCFTTGGYNHEVALRVLFRERDRQDYIALRQPLRAAVHLVNELNREATPVALFGPALATDLRADVLVPSWYNHVFATEVDVAKTPESLGELLAGRRVRYVLLSASWSDEAGRERVRAVSQEVRAIGDVSVRVLDERYRFRRELLRGGRFDDATAWEIGPEARLEAGRGVVVTVAAPAVQKVEVTGGREYRVQAQVQRVDPLAPTNARLQVTWLDARGRTVDLHIQVFACQAEATAPSMDVVAPLGAVAALVYATGHSASPVRFLELSFRQ